MPPRIFMTGESGDHNMGDEAQALASAARLRRYFPEAQIVATGIDLLGSALRHQAQIVPWPLSPSDLKPGRLQRMIRGIARRLGVNEGFMDPAGRKMEAIFDEEYHQ